MTAASLEVKDVTRVFRLGSEDVHALKGVSIAVEPREFVALIGRSGSGKTTLLNIMAGLDKPTSGEVWFEGARIDQLGERELTLLRRRQLGFIFQSFGLLPLLSAQENVELPLRIAGFSHGERVRLAKNALDLVGLTRRAHHRPYELSGGEQQRVAIARAIATEPKMILADEPTGELDSTTAKAVFGLLRALGREVGFTVITCTHDRLVMEMADRVQELADGELVGQDGEVWTTIQARGRSPFEAGFVGSDRQEGEDGPAGLSSLVGADTAIFAKPKPVRATDEPEKMKTIVAAAEEEAPEEETAWARPGSRQ